MNCVSISKDVSIILTAGQISGENLQRSSLKDKTVQEQLILKPKRL